MAAVRICKYMLSASIFCSFLIQIENSAEEFALYVVHTSGGKYKEHSILKTFN